MGWKHFLKLITNYGTCSRWKSISHALVAGREKSHYIAQLKASHLRAYIISWMFEQFDAQPADRPFE